MMTPAQKAQLLAQSRARPKGLAAVQGAGAPPAPAVAPPGRTPLELSATPTGPMQLEPLAGGMAASGFKGSPGACCYGDPIKIQSSVQTRGLSFEARLRLLGCVEVSVRSLKKGAGFFVF